MLNDNEFDIGTGLVASTSSEDILKLQLKIDEDGIVEEMDYKIFGRPSSIQSAKFLPMLLTGFSINDILSMDVYDIDEDAIYGELVLMAVQSAAANYIKKREVEHDSIESEVKDANGFN